MQRVDEILLQVAEDTFTQLTFMFPEDAGYEDPVSTPSDIMASVQFKGPFSGVLTIETSFPVLAEMTANMLGSGTGETSKEEKADALKEILNVICGNVLPKIGGTTAVFDIGAPQIFREAAPLGKEAAIAHLLLEGGFCRVKLFVEGDLPEPS